MSSNVVNAMGNGSTWRPSATILSMQDRKLTRAEQIDLIWTTCGYPNRAAFAKALEVEPQSFNNWERRGFSREAGSKLRTVTGVSLDWLMDQTGKPFPDGAKRAVTARPAAAAIRRLEQEIDQLQTVLGVLARALSESAPRVAAAFREHLAEDVGPGAVEDGLYPMILTALGTAPEKVEASRSSSSGKPRASR